MKIVCGIGEGLVGCRCRRYMSPTASHTHPTPNVACRHRVFAGTVRSSTIVKILLRVSNSIKYNVPPQPTYFVCMTHVPSTTPSTLPPLLLHSTTKNALIHQKCPQPRQVTDVWRMSQSALLIGPAIIAGQNSSPSSSYAVHVVLAVRTISTLTFSSVLCDMRIFCMRIFIQEIRFHSSHFLIGTLIFPV